MVQIDVEILGLDKLTRNFQQSPQIVASELDKAIKTIGTKISENSKSVTPVKTGALKGSIRPSFSKLKAVIQPHKDYGIWVHQGNGRMRARPFLKWGLEKSVPEIEIELKNTGNRILNKISKI